ncbi:BOLA3 [Bugula neritina]|uniref:BOLA3 n=1 Tax=Bugula neritina TaxID=10212 RepID=A0A7J7J1G4_BUGNE|nr:BOLA3 [Bugula neritina]
MPVSEYERLPSSIISRYLSSGLTDREQQIRDVIHKNFPNAQTVTVEDISGGCGAMFDVHIESADFNGKKLVQQHMMVNKALKAEISDMHGIRISTKTIPE